MAEVSLLQQRLSLYSIPLVWLTAFLPGTFKTTLIMRHTQAFTNVTPRTNGSRAAAEKNLPPDISAKILRLEGAHMNGNENLPIWFAAIVGHIVGNMAKLDNYTLNMLSLSYICGRMLFNYIYYQQRTELQGALRSTVFFICFGEGFIQVHMHLDRVTN
ncbi:hypothetical protein HMN09_00194900 [Mycena chlorophos]|uniref:Uncharacterized protein n=1 Tax=Mycena chlorophos TaxID=658473 RepID=A0A8H6TNY3_MYCCL|nr:hypothetical protein HMN09_00194900 [Mycena chlorophos]